MPSLFDIFFDPATLATFVMLAALACWEWLAPGRALPEVKGWRLRSTLVLTGFVLVSAYLPLLWGAWLAPLQVFDLNNWPTLAAAALGVLIYEFGAYAYHRAMHTFNPLWRMLHQMHHSAERQEVMGAFWFSPLDMVGWTLLPSVVLTVLGLPAPATTSALLCITFLSIFQHANVRTPVWLGYFIQRPESHSVHHEREVHRYNYADLPLIDMLFGTFYNPRNFSHAVGFWDGASRRMLDMLLFRDVSRPGR